MRDRMELLRWEAWAGLDELEVTFEPVLLLRPATTAAAALSLICTRRFRLPKVCISLEENSSRKMKKLVVCGPDFAIVPCSVPNSPSPSLLSRFSTPPLSVEMLLRSLSLPLDPVLST